ncbi:NnrU family protein [Marinovum sp.]|uniref:NnrU family protein n=1 Tax=Marinovum sp. TaxID=2024839 RepID=UPI003A95DB6E
MGWTGFTAIFAAFFLTHSLPLRPAVKSGLVRRLGPRRFTLAYSAVSLMMLALLIWAAGEAPYVELWPQMDWHRHTVHRGMLAVCLMLALSLGRPNPFSFGGMHNDRFYPARPGLVRWIRHPVLVALALWAGLHLLVNGDLAHVILFGVLGSFAVAGQGLVNRRKRREMGTSAWQALRATVREAPPLHPPVSWTGLLLRLAAGIAAFVALLAAHPFVIGVSAL